MAGARVDLELHASARLGRSLRIELGQGSRTRVSVGARSRLGDDVLLRLRGGELEIGESVDVRARCVLNVGGGRLLLEGPNNLGWGVVIHCAEAVTIRRHAHVAEYATIVDSSHYFTTPDSWSYHNTRTRPVELGEDVWVCPKATIASGVTIGDHTIVGANSVVIRTAPSGVLLSGVPASVVRQLDLPWRNGKSTVPTP